MLAVDGALSHRSAGNAWRSFDWVPARIEVTVPTGGTHRRPDLLIHTSPLPADEVTVLDGIPITTPARTAVDLAHALADHDRIHGVLREMQYRRIFDLDALARANARRPSATLSRAIADLRPTRSPLEDAFLLKVVRRHGLPEPDVQSPFDGMHVDFRWLAARVTVEVDGNHHVNPAMLQADAPARAPDAPRLVHPRDAPAVEGAARRRRAPRCAAGGASRGR